MGTIQRAIIGKHIAAQRHLPPPPDPFNADGFCVCHIALQGPLIFLGFVLKLVGGKSLIFS